jgi:hypothetical protein
MAQPEWIDPFYVSNGPDRSIRKNRIKKWHSKGAQGNCRQWSSWVKNMRKVGNRSMRQQRKRDAGDLKKGKSVNGQKETRSYLKYKKWKEW